MKSAPDIWSMPDMIELRRYNEGKPFSLIELPALCEHPYSTVRFSHFVVENVVEVRCYGCKSKVEITDADVHSFTGGIYAQSNVWREIRRRLTESVCARVER